MTLKKNFLYSDKGSNNADQVFVLDSARELLKSFGDPGTWENLTEIINKIKEYTNTSSKKYSEFKPKELLEPGLNLDSELDQMKIDIMNILNDINDFIAGYDKENHGDIATSSGNNGGNTYYTEPINTETPSVIEGSTVTEAVAPVVVADDTNTQSEVITDVGITTSPEAETTIPDNPGQPLGQLYVEDNGTIDVFDADGKKIDTYTKGKYNIYEYKYDENGKPIAARISPDGEDEKWIKLTDTSDKVYIVEEGQKGNYNLGENSFPVYDENGTQTGTVNAGDYTVYETKYDKDGNPIAVRISPDGEDEKWLYLTPGETNGYYYEIGQKGNYFLKDESLSIFDENGNVIGTATPGNYTVYGTKMDAQGNITAIRISKPGEPEQWLYVNSNTNGFYIALGQKGTYSLSGQTLNIFDNKGNIIGTLSDGNYTVYEVKYDANGNAIAIRISPNGKEEQWIFPTGEDGKIIGEFKSVEQMMKLDDGKAIITTVTKKKNNSLKYLGILAGLTVALGTTLVVKKKINQKNENTDEYENDEYIEEPLEPGEYNVYEFKKDENNNITDARISEDNAKEDLWVHF